jgi:hypothetical protein
MNQRAPSALAALLYLMELALTNPLGSSNSQQPGITLSEGRVSQDDAQAGECMNAAVITGSAPAAAPITDAEGPVTIRLVQMAQ